jgi:hypothetical protein
MDADRHGGPGRVRGRVHLFGAACRFRAAAGSRSWFGSCWGRRLRRGLADRLPVLARRSPLALRDLPRAAGPRARARDRQRGLRLAALDPDGTVSFQPSETANIAVLLITASLLVRSKIGTVSQSLGVLGKLALAVGVPMLLILKQPDLKSAIVLPPMVFSMLYVSRLSGRFFAGALAAFLLVVGLVALGHLALHGFHGVERLLVPGGPGPLRDSTAGCRSTTISATASSPSSTRTRSTRWGSAGTSASR